MESTFSADKLIAALNRHDYDLINGALTAWMNSPLPALKKVASEFMHNEEMATAIEKSLNAPKAGQKEDYVCKWFYHWYQIDSIETRRFVLRYVPQLVWIYLYNVFNNEAPPGVEACLLCIYNQEVVERNDMEIIFHPPTLSLPSYLHKTSDAQVPPAPNAAAMLQPPAFTAPGLGPNPNAIQPPNNLGQSAALTENALRQFNKQVKSVTVEKALKPIDLPTTANRELIIRVALQRYNSNISLFPPRSWIAYCKMCKRLVNHGFDFTITPIPLLKSKSFSKKYIEDDLDNLIIDSDEDLDDLDDDFGDEMSDSDGDSKPRDVEKVISPGTGSGTRRRRARKPKSPTPGTPGTPKKRTQKHLRDASSSSSSSLSNSKGIPPLSFPNSTAPSSSSSPSSPATTPKKDTAAGETHPITTTTTTTTTTTQNNTNNNTTNNNTSTNNNNNVNNNSISNISNIHEANSGAENQQSPKSAPKPPVRIILTPSCLQEMVTGLTFCIFKESYKEHALKALRKIHLRACYDLMPEIILSANALLYLEFQENKNKAAALQPTKTTPR
eukprot:Phypoly_transcript_03071.p1 GENE.Phypoly_transcript_03071~~Phypoly_transcript_03071.p1  ORF type:complete len:556 (+),score=142.69 Phypoly_transcript_03071:132-1799(+)